ncbi:unnamed protein product [Closterium sp. NIES-54]
MVMDIARTSMIHAAAPLFLWPFAVQYAAHQINLQPSVSLPETTPTLRWTGKVGDASAFRVWGSRAFVRDTTTEKLSSRADVAFDESVSYYRLFAYRTTSLPPPPLFLSPGTPPVDPLPPQGPAPSGLSQVDPAEPVEVAVDSGAARGVEPAGAGIGGAGTGGAEPERVEPGGVESEVAESGCAEPGGAGAGGTRAGDAGAGDPGAGGAGAGGAGASGTGAGGIVQRRLFFVPPLPSSLPPLGSVLRQETDSLTERREPESRPASPFRTIRTGRRVPCPRPHLVPSTHITALRPSSVPLRVPLLSPPVFSLADALDPESDLARAASPTVPRLLATVVTDPAFESAAASALVAELVDFATACCLDYAASLVAESESDCPSSVTGERALGTDVLEDSQEDFECLAAAVPHLMAMLFAPEGDRDALDTPTPHSYVEAIMGP